MRAQGNAATASTRLLAQWRGSRPDCSGSPGAHPHPGYRRRLHRDGGGRSPSWAAATQGRIPGGAAQRATQSAQRGAHRSRRPHPASKQHPPSPVSLPATPPPTTTPRPPCPAGQRKAQPAATYPWSPRWQPPPRRRRQLPHRPSPWHLLVLPHRPPPWPRRRPTAAAVVKQRRAGGGSGGSATGRAAAPRPAASQPELRSRGEEEGGAAKHPNKGMGGGGRRGQRRQGAAERASRWEACVGRWATCHLPPARCSSCGVWAGECTLGALRGDGCGRALSGGGLGGRDWERGQANHTAWVTLTRCASQTPTRKKYSFGGLTHVNAPLIGRCLKDVTSIGKNSCS